MPGRDAFDTWKALEAEVRERIEQILTRLFVIAYSSNWRLAYLDKDGNLVQVGNARSAAQWLLEAYEEKMGKLPEETWAN